MTDINTTVAINNLAGNPLYFARQREGGTRDIVIPANVKNYSILSFGEIQAQIAIGNPLFLGEDGFGSHARLQICNESVRKELFNIPEDAPEPELLTLDEVKKLLEVKAQKTFIKKLNELVVTSAERRVLLKLALEAGVENKEAWKLREIENFLKEEE